MLSQHAPLHSSQAVIFGAGFLDGGGDAADVLEGFLGGVLHLLEGVPQDAQLDDEHVHAVVERLDDGLDDEAGDAPEVSGSLDVTALPALLRSLADAERGKADFARLASATTAGVNQ